MMAELPLPLSGSAWERFVDEEEQLAASAVPEKELMAEAAALGSLLGQT